MGFLREKYTREYYTGRDSAGNRIPGFGVLGVQEWEQGGIFHDIKAAIDAAPTRRRRVLEIGFGRGESARYLLTTVGAEFYCGVDFSNAAMDIASSALNGIDQKRYELVLADALVWLRERKFRESFDLVLMLDTIEHIPAVEVREMLPLLFRAVRWGGFIVVHTPHYQVDEDFIEQGFVYKDPSPSDLNPATKGMHCNKFTRRRLIEEMRSAGFADRNSLAFKKARFPKLYELYYEFWRRLPYANSAGKIR